MNLRKKIASCLLIGCFALPVVSNTVFAYKNAEDSIITSCGVYTGNFETSSRKKYTDDCIYLKISEVTDNGGQLNYYAVSAKNWSNSTHADTRSWDGTYQKQFRKLAVGTEYLLYNYVYECANDNKTLKYDRGNDAYYTNCSLVFRPARNGAKSSIAGKWSPDSYATSKTKYAWGTFVKSDSYPN